MIRPHPIGQVALLLCAITGLSGCKVMLEDDAENGAGDQAAQGGDLIECAVGGAAYFSSDCTVQQVREDGVLTLVVRHPDGGFRRFEVLTDGRGIGVADGAEQALTKLDDGTLEVAVGPDRYRFPATVRSDEPGE